MEDPFEFEDLPKLKGISENEGLLKGSCKTSFKSSCCTNLRCTHLQSFT